MTAPATLREASCADDYDPNSMPVDKARAFISKFLAPITVTERLHIRAALGRVVSPRNERAYTNGYDSVLREAGALPPLNFRAVSYDDQLPV